VIVLHVSPPNVPNYPIIASNIGRIGKAADDDDMKVINSGEPIVGVYGEGKRYGVELPLRDAANKTIGALSVGFRYKSGDEKALLSKAEKIRDELRNRIPSVENLVELDP
jgi:iron complex outermembrane receptor protein